jgi:release factor glutamine methyltransferase
MQTIKAAIIFATNLLTSPTPRLDAEKLLAHALKKSRSYCFSHPEQTLTPLQEKIFEELVARRKQGEPVAYILGKQGFWNSDFLVTPATLIPRPETEMLVENTLALLPIEHEIRVADLGTGSGAIALSLAAECPNWRVTATDISEAALEVAKQNAENNALRNLEFQQGAWCLAILGKNFHAIVSNPPYIAENDPHLSHGDLRFEPHGALIAGPDGLDALREIISNAGDHLLNGGYLLLEHGYTQGKSVRELMALSGFKKIRTEHDLAGHERITIGEWSCEKLS